MVKDWDAGWFPDDPLGRAELDMDEYVRELNKRNVNGTLNHDPMDLFLTEPTGGIIKIWPIYD